MSKTKILAIIITLIALLLTFLTARAQTTPPPLNPDTGITLQAEAAFEGAFKYGEWVPVWVTIENNGPDRQAEARITVTGSGGTMIFVTPVELPTGARKRLPLYALPNNFSRQLMVELRSDDKPLASAKVAIQPNPVINYLVGIVAPQRGALSLLETLDIPGQTRPVKLHDLKLEDFPDKFEGLRSFDLIVINDTDTSGLSPEQAAALEAWVRQGGRLVVGGGANAKATLLGLPKTLLPIADLRNETVMELSGLESFVGPDTPIHVQGPFVTAFGEMDGGRQLAEQSQGDAGGDANGVLVQEWDMDHGRVDWSALDLSGSPFDAWNGAVPFWEKLVVPGASFPDYAPMDVSARQQFAANLNYPLSNLPMLDLPSVGSLSLLLGLYVLLVGPFNYFLLRRMKRLHLAWLTIPAITVIFAAASFGLGYALRGSNVFINKLAFIEPDASGKAKVITFIGLFSPAQEGYEVQVRGGGNLISPLGPFYDPWMSSTPPSGSTGRSLELVQGDPAFVRGLSMEQWSMQSFMAEGMLMDFGKLSGDLSIDGDHLAGIVTNDSPYTLKDAMLVFGVRAARLGDLAPGASAEVKIDLLDMPSPNMGPSVSYSIFEQELSGANGPAPREIEVKRAIVENIFERVPPFIAAPKDGSQSSSALQQTPVLIGWLDQAPPEVSVTSEEAAQQTTAVVVYPMAYHLPENGPVTLPPGLIQGILESTPVNGGTCGMPGTAGVYMPNGQAVFKFTIPEGLRGLQAPSLKLNLSTDAGMTGTPELSLYDWQNERWLILDGAQMGINMIPQAAGLINDQGQVRVRLSTENAQGCYYIGMGLEGQR